ncbi:hypothetical protein HK405_004422, partial [Cladochytrium tenue]
LFVGRTGKLDQGTTVLIVDTPGLNEQKQELKTVVIQFQQAADIQILFLPSTVRQKNNLTTDVARQTEFRMCEEVLKTACALKTLLVYSRMDQGNREFEDIDRASLLKDHEIACATHDKL